MPVTTYVTDAAIKQTVADMLNVDQTAWTTELSALWDRHVEKGNVNAYNTIRRVLLGRGYTTSQIDEWDEAESFNHDIGLFWALTYGTMLHSIAAEVLEPLNRLKELESVELYESDELVEPDDTGAGNGATVGDLDFTESNWTPDDSW